MKEGRERALAPAELEQARASLAQARGRKRLDVILGARNPRALVRALPADELYLTIRDVGLSDAAVLVQLASAYQFKVFLDLEAWRHDAFDPRKALPWLRAARAGAQREPRAAARWARKLARLDAEVLLLVLRATVRAHDLEKDPDPEFESEHFMRAPEGKYMIEFLVEGVEYAAIRGLLDDLYAENPFMATRLLSSLEWDLPSEVEESALRWRTGRLADLGHPTLEDALSWFARPPRAPGDATAVSARPPGFFLATLASGSLLDRAAARLAPEDREPLEGQIVAAANAVLVADAIDPGDVDARARLARSGDPPPRGRGDPLRRADRRGARGARREAAALLPRSRGPRGRVGHHRRRGPRAAPLPDGGGSRADGAGARSGGGSGFASVVRTAGGQVEVEVEVHDHDHDHDHVHVHDGALTRPPAGR